MEVIKIWTSLLLAICCFSGARSAVFTIRNNCPFPISPAAVTGAGSPIQPGPELQPHASSAINVPTPWSGRIWARFSGDGGYPPASLVEFTLAGYQNKDFYDISLVDGFNLPVSVAPSGGNCPTVSCPVNINQNGCPNELAVRGRNGSVVGCKSACLAFNRPEYCCTGAYSNPTTCKPTNYSQIFKSRCPQAYSYAYDDKSSTFTCPTGSNYLITFCP